MAYRVLLVGGGSGGHLYPLIAVANSLKTKAAPSGVPLEMKLLGDGPFLKRVADETGLKYSTVFAGKLRRYTSALTITDLLFKVPLGVIQSLWHLWLYMPDAVFAKGGYSSLAPVIAARAYLIPVYIHESDSVPGMTNKYLGMLARKVFVAFEAAKKFFNGGKTVTVGNPVRAELFGTDKPAALAAFGFNSQKPTLLIMGGSQGAQQLNELVLNTLVVMAQQYQIIHQCGDTQIQAVQAEVDKVMKEGEGAYADLVKANYKLFPFLDRQQMAQAYAAADVIVSRAGAGSLFEIAAAGKPAIVIPLPNSANNHQLVNAIEFSKFGAVVIEGANATGAVLLNQIQGLLEPGRYAQVSQQIKGFAVPDSADKIAEAILTKS